MQNIGNKLRICTQVAEEAQAIGLHCNIKASVWTGEGPRAVQANAYRTAGQFVVSTPGRVAQALENGLIQTTLLTKTLSIFVLDEADLLLLHEYESDLQAIAPQVMIRMRTALSPPIYCAEPGCSGTLHITHSGSACHVAAEGCLELTCSMQDYTSECYLLPDGTDLYWVNLYLRSAVQLKPLEAVQSL